MLLSELKEHLKSPDNNKLILILPDGKAVPAHFHITEAGFSVKKFIDCGGQIREDKKAIFQVWTASDYSHRLSPKKLLRILEISEPLIGNDDPEIEIEYQSDTIGKYGMDYDGKHFLLTPTQTDCLAKEHCGISKPRKAVADSECCTPGSGCC